VTDQFIKGLDPSKTNFLESDVESLKSKLSAAFAEVQRGKCGLLEEAHALLVKRMQESRDYLDQYLGPNYKFDENTDLILNPDLRGYWKTADERNAYLAKMAHFQVSNYMMTDTKLDEAKRLLKKRNDLGLKRALERKTSDILDIYAEAFAHSLDPHSSYMSADVFDDFQIQMQLSLEGIGASLTSEDGYTVFSAAWTSSGRMMDPTFGLATRGRITILNRRGVGTILLIAYYPIGVLVEVEVSSWAAASPRPPRPASLRGRRCRRP
jgi:carboxyl-terminal processing protease